MSTEQNQIDVTPWQVELMRLTAFTAGSHGSDVDQWWGTVVKEPPESKTEKLRESLRTLEGHIGKAKLILASVFDRIDWLMGVDIKIGEDFVEAPNIGPYEGNRQLFCSTIRPWFSNCPPITRLAWGSTLIMPVADRETGYETLKKYLHSLSLDSENSSELLYQINRPRKSENLPDFTINRLQKWSVMLVRPFSLTVTASPGVSAQTTQNSLGAGVSACRLELDISSPLDHTEPIPVDQLPALFDELVGLGTEISEHGDIA